MDAVYKGHHIHSTARPILESGRWIPHIVINWTGGSREIDMRRGFETQQDAEQAGITFAKHWIDDGKPRIRN